MKKESSVIFSGMTLDISTIVYGISHAQEYCVCQKKREKKYTFFGGFCCCRFGFYLREKKKEYEIGLVGRAEI